MLELATKPSSPLLSLIKGVQQATKIKINTQEKKSVTSFYFSDRFFCH